MPTRFFSPAQINNTLLLAMCCASNNCINAYIYMTKYYIQIWSGARSSYISPSALISCQLITVYTFPLVTFLNSLHSEYVIFIFIIHINFTDLYLRFRSSATRKMVLRIFPRVRTRSPRSSSREVWGSADIDAFKYGLGGTTVRFFKGVSLIHAGSRSFWVILINGQTWLVSNAVITFTHNLFDWIFRASR